MIDFTKISNSEIAILFHFGLGDHIIVNGIVNYLISKNNKITLFIKSNVKNHLVYLYKDKNVNLVEITEESLKDTLTEYEKNNNNKVFKIGFDNVGSIPFNLAFYQLTNLPYSFSYKYFSAPLEPTLENKIYELLVREKNINDFVLVHNESSQGMQNLKINTSLPKIYITKSSDPFGNIFFYKKIIKNAKEIHCLDSSFLHVVERFQTDAKLFFHDIFIASVKLTKNWKYIYYYDRN